MNRVKVTLCGSDYTIVTDESAEYVNALAANVNQDIEQLLESAPTMSVVSAALLCALNYKDEGKKIDASSDHLRTQVSDYIEEANTVKVQLEQANQRILQLETQIQLLKGEQHIS